MVDTMALGKMCRNMISKSPRPKALAARTYSRFLPLKNSARTRSTSIIQLNNSMIPKSHQIDPSVLFHHPGMNLRDSLVNLVDGILVVLGRGPKLVFDPVGFGKMNEHEFFFPRELLGKVLQIGFCSKLKVGHSDVEEFCFLLSK